MFHAPKPAATPAGRNHRSHSPHRPPLGTAAGARIVRPLAILKGLDIVAPSLGVGDNPIVSSNVVRSDIRYARSRGVAIAYQVVGDGDIDLVFVPEFGSNLVYAWEYPPWRDFYERLGRLDG